MTTKRLTNNQDELIHCNCDVAMAPAAAIPTSRHLLPMRTTPAGERSHWRPKTGKTDAFSQFSRWGVVERRQEASLEKAYSTNRTKPREEEMNLDHPVDSTRARNSRSSQTPSSERYGLSERIFFYWS